MTRAEEIALKLKQVMDNNRSQIAMDGVADSVPTVSPAKKLNTLNNITKPSVDERMIQEPISLDSFRSKTSQVEKRISSLAQGPKAQIESKIKALTPSDKTYEKDILKQVDTKIQVPDVVKRADASPLGKQIQEKITSMLGYTKGENIFKSPEDLGSSIIYYQENKLSEPQKLYVKYTKKSGKIEGYDINGKFMTITPEKVIEAPSVAQVNVANDKERKQVTMENLGAEAYKERLREEKAFKRITTQASTVQADIIKNIGSGNIPRQKLAEKIIYKGKEYPTENITIKELDTMFGNAVATFLGIAPIYGAIYAALGPAANAVTNGGLVATGVTGGGFSSVMITELLKDIMVTPVVAAITKGQEGELTTQGFINNFAMDIIMNMFMFGLGEGLKPIASKIGDFLGDTVQGFKHLGQLGSEIPGVSVPASKGRGDDIIKGLIPDTTKPLQEAVPEIKPEIELKPLTAGIEPKGIVQDIATPEIKPSMIEDIAQPKAVTDMTDLTKSLVETTETGKPTTYKLPETAINKMDITDEFKQEIAKGLEEGMFVRSTGKNVEAVNIAKRILAESEQNRSVVRAMLNDEKTTYNNAIETALGMEYILDAQAKALAITSPAGKQIALDEALDLFAKQAKKVKLSGQSISIINSYAELDPYTKVRDIERAYEKYNKTVKGAKNPLVLSPENKTYLMTSDSELKTMNKEDLITWIVEWNKRVTGRKANKLITNALDEKFSLEEIQGRALTMLQQEFTWKIPRTISRQVSTYQAMSHLISPRTFGRNLFGNLTQYEYQALATPFAKSYDDIIKTLRGKKGYSTVGDRYSIISQLSKPANERNIAFQFAQSQALDASQKEIVDIYFGLQDIAGKYMSGAKTFTLDKTGVKQVLSRLENFLGYELKVPDTYFKTLEETMEYITLGAKNIGNEQITKQQIADIAREWSLRNTFMDNSLGSKMFTGLKEGLNKIGTGDVIPGTILKETREMGVGEMTIKYARVAGNIFSRIIDNTPVGYFSAMLDAMKTLYKGWTPQAQANIANKMGSASLGTIVVGLGYWLKKSGIVDNIASTSNPDQKAIEKSEGKGQFTINISAIGRFFTGGDTQPQDGDTYTELTGWFETIAKPLYLGVALYELLTNPSLSSGEKAREMLNSIVEGFLDISVMDTFRNIYYGYQDSGIIGAITQSATQNITGFIPAPIRSIAQATDTTKKDIYSGTQKEQFIKQLMSSIPGLRGMLPEEKTPLGESYDIDPLQNIISSLVLPGKVTTLKQSDITKHIDIINSLLSPAQIKAYAGTTNLYPTKKIPSSLTIKVEDESGAYVDEKFELTQEERTEWRRLYAELYNLIYEEEMSEEFVKNEPEEASRLLAKLDALAVKYASDTIKEKHY